MSSLWVLLPGSKASEMKDGMMSESPSLVKYWLPEAKRESARCIMYERRGYTQFYQDQQVLCGIKSEVYDVELKRTMSPLACFSASYTGWQLDSRERVLCCSTIYPGREFIQMPMRHRNSGFLPVEGMPSIDVFLKQRESSGGRHRESIWT